MGPRNRVRWGPDPPWEEVIWRGKGAPIVKYRDFLPWTVQKHWTNQFSVWVVDSGGLKEAQVQSYLKDGANVPSWDGTLALYGEYNWTVRLRRRCGLMSNYFDHLFMANGALCSTAGHIYFHSVVCSSLWSPYGIGQIIIFSPCRLFFFFFLFFPRLISAVAEWMSAILAHMVWPLCKFRMQVWNVLLAARWKYRTQKIDIWAPSHNFVRLYLRN